MDEIEILNKIKEIVFLMPSEMYKFPPPQDCFEGEWEEASIEEKAFLLIEELLLNSNREQLNQGKQEECKDDIEVKIAIAPRFYSGADENMFFNALNSMPSIKKIKGSGRGLNLYFKSSISFEEKQFLKGLLKRYQVLIPKEIEN